METMKAFGAIPTPMPFAEVATAIVQGLVDGQENALLHIKANKTYEVQKYLAVVDYMYGPAPLLVNKPWFEKLSENDRKIIMDAAAAGNAHMRKVAAERNKEAIKFFEEQGLKITYPDKLGFKEKVKSLYDGVWAEKFGKGLLDRISTTK
jgi:TRAP-type C4-dicarboxylate transport system substrate-binding protein